LPCTVSALIFCRLANQRILELESQVEELQQNFTDLQQQLRKAEEEKETKDTQLEEQKVSVEEYSMYLHLLEFSGYGCNQIGLSIAFVCVVM